MPCTHAAMCSDDPTMILLLRDPDTCGDKKWLITPSDDLTVAIITRMHSLLCSLLRNHQVPDHHCLKRLQFQGLERRARQRSFSRPTALGHSRRATQMPITHHGNRFLQKPADDNGIHIVAGPLILLCKQSEEPHSYLRIVPVHRREEAIVLLGEALR